MRAGRSARAQWRRRSQRPGARMDPTAKIMREAWRCPCPRGCHRLLPPSALQPHLAPCWTTNGFGVPLLGPAAGAAGCNRTARSLPHHVGVEARLRRQKRRTSLRPCRPLWFGWTGVGSAGRDGMEQGAWAPPRVPSDCVRPRPFVCGTTLDCGLGEHRAWASTAGSQPGRGPTRPTVALSAAWRLVWWDGKRWEQCTRQGSSAPGGQVQEGRPEREGSGPFNPTPRPRPACHPVHNELCKPVQQWGGPPTGRAQAERGARHSATGRHHWALCPLAGSVQRALPGDVPTRLPTCLHAWTISNGPVAWAPVFACRPVNY